MLDIMTRAMVVTAEIFRQVSGRYSKGYMMLCSLCLLLVLTVLTNYLFIDAMQRRSVHDNRSNEQISSETTHKL
jgi:hypothetical protein